MASEKSQNPLEKLRFMKSSSRPNSKALSEADTVVATVSSDASDLDNPQSDQPSKKPSSIPDLPVSTQPSGLESTKSDTDTVMTTNSSPTDPSYIPNELGTGGRLANSISTPNAVLRPPILPNPAVERSFFDFDTESEDEEPVVGRASSVRMSKPNFVEQNPTPQEQSGRMIGVSLEKKHRTLSPIPARISEAYEPTIDGHDTTPKNQGRPTDALDILNGGNTKQDLPTQSQSTTDSQLMDDLANLPEKSKRGGLYMNPVTDKDQGSIHRAISAPPIPLRSSSGRKVRIRPSDLIVGHSKGDSRLFRESIVTTPYPLLDGIDEKAADNGINGDERTTTLPRSSDTIKYARFENDRFPSPDRPEALFLTLGLANHPSATTTLEIKIVDKSTYDDEMLFRQIRSAYRSRLLGTSRFAFQLIRGVSYATVTPSVQYDFNWKEFTKHLGNPGLGRKRKRWIIWLRHHSRQQPSTEGDDPHVVKRPLSASLRTADKRSSMHSDSTSTFNFPFLPPLMMPRIPFFTKQATTSPALASPLTAVPEDGGGIVKIDLHHEFSFWVLAFLSLWVMSLSVAAVILWIVFGVPGSRPGHNSQTAAGTGPSPTMAWHAAAQARVLTGLVLGMMVALLGSMVELCLVAGAYILL